MKRPLSHLPRSSVLDLILGVGALGVVAVVLILVVRSNALPDEEAASLENDALSDIADLPAFGGPGAGGPGGQAGPGGARRQTTKVLEQFDEDNNGWLNATEREAALVHLETERANGGPGGGRGGFRGGGRFGGGGGDQGEPETGPQMTPSDVASYPDAPLYDPFTLRSLFLEFESDDWEDELEKFHDTDVDVPASLEVDGQKLRHVGVRFRGNTSYSSIGSGRKRPLNLTLDMVYPKQEIGGYNTLNLLNSHSDPTFLRNVLYYEIARQYIPAFKANFVRLVINGESWGLYINVQQFDSNFTRDFFGTPMGARWKVPGSPLGQGGFSYLGDDIDSYRSTFELKTREDPKSWVGLMLLFDTLNNAPSELLESALAQILNVDGVLKFLALDNVFVNGDGFWTRASDYNLYQDPHGKFHIFPYDANETFSVGRGGGGPGGARGGRGQGGRGRGGPGGFSPGTFLAPGLIAQADVNNDRQIDRDEFVGIADVWFTESEMDISASMTAEQFISTLSQWGNEGGQPFQGRGGFSPIGFTGRYLFRSIDADGDGFVMHSDLLKLLGDWYAEWDEDQNNELAVDQLTEGLDQTLSRLRQRAAGGQNPGGFRGVGGRGGPAGGRGAGGAPGGGRPGGGGVDLDPLVLANDESKPLASKLLLVPELRARYLSYVRDIAENWLDWEKSGPRILRYQALIEEVVEEDTRKLDTTEAFYAAFDNGGVDEERTLRGFMERRQAYLLGNEDVAGAKKISP
ncbi:CotH kinase family protein [Opitutia bacterium ISCC 51]|nr:CotH kinase family protein [Opitutae bacterium ISCC 51]QXD30251.1 CotH kinase family protein [Opitutae bacterium ISCC 52]